MSSSDTITINRHELLLRLARELTNEQSNAKREADLIKRQEKLYEVGNKMEFLLRVR